jgi:hypothetical protein
MCHYSHMGAMHIHLILIIQTNYKVFFPLSSVKLPWLHVRPVKPGSHRQVNELYAFGMHVPCLLHTSGVHTILRIDIILNATNYVLFIEKSTIHTLSICQNVKIEKWENEKNWYEHE